MMSQFTVIRLIGQGAQGKVFLSRHKRSNILYAIKQVNKKTASQLFVKATDFQEAEVLIATTKKKCRNLIKVVQVIESCKLYMVTEYMEGGTLFDLF